MKIKQDPVSKLWCREDGAVLMPPSKGRFKTFRWTFGSDHGDGYRRVMYLGKSHSVHRIICGAFNGLPPEGKPCVDHINRIRDDNRPSNLHWVSAKENSDNQGCVDQSIAKYGVRACDDKKAWGAAYIAAHREEYRARDKACYERHREERKAYAAAYRAKMKAQGFTKRKGPDGKWGWYPINRA